MPTSIIKKLSPLQGVVPGETATLDLTPGPRYKNIILEGTVKPAAAGTATLAMIFGLIKININGKTQRQFTGTELVALNPLNGVEFDVEIENVTDPGTAPAADDTIKYRITILFGEPFRKSYAADQAMNWPTAWPGGVNVGTFQIEVEIPLTTGATLHAVVAYAELDNQLGVLGDNGKTVFNISKWRRQTIIYTAAGELFITTLPKRDRYQSMHLFTQTGDPITDIKIVKDNEVILDIPKTINDNNLITRGINPLALSANRMDVIFDRDDLPDSGLELDGASEWQVIPTLGNAAAGNKVITLITQAFGPID